MSRDYDKSANLGVRFWVLGLGNTEGRPETEIKVPSAEYHVF